MSTLRPLVNPRGFPPIAWLWRRCLPTSSPDVTRSGPPPRHAHTHTRAHTGPPARRRQEAPAPATANHPSLSDYRGPTHSQTSLCLALSRSVSPSLHFFGFFVSHFLPSRHSRTREPYLLVFLFILRTCTSASPIVICLPAAAAPALAPSSAPLLSPILTYAARPHTHPSAPRFPAFKQNSSSRGLSLLSAFSSRTRENFAPPVPSSVPSLP
jgi:hypothetical protein